jgi:hypothetical protein
MTYAVLACHFVVHCVAAKLVRTSVSFLVPLDNCHLPTRSNTGNPSIASIELEAVPQAGGLQSSFAIISLNCHHQASLEDSTNETPCPKPQLDLAPNHKQKKASHVKKSLSLAIFVQEN